MIIFCDLDGVLVDLNKGCLNYFGHPWISYRPNLSGDLDLKRKNLEIHIKNPEFWANQPPMSDYDVLWQYIKVHDPHILTAYAFAAEGGIHEGKHRWNELWLKVPKERFHVVERKNKQQFAKGNVLIDDYDKNIKEWTEAGGTGIFHKSAVETVEELKKLGI